MDVTKRVCCLIPEIGVMLENVFDVVVHVSGMNQKFNMSCFNFIAFLNSLGQEKYIAQKSMLISRFFALKFCFFQDFSKMLTK